MSQSSETTYSTARNDRDCELYRQYMAGDSDAFARLYTGYERQLMVYCQHLLRTAQEAQDVFQETWAKIIELRRRGQTIEHFRAILFTIARNTALKRLGRIKQMQGNVEIDPENEPGGPEDMGRYSEIEELVNKALRRLPVVQREAFVLHAVLGYTFQEIAEMQGGSMTAAKTRAFRARSYLRKLLANWLGMAEEEMSDI